MDDQQRKIITDWKTILERSLNPISLLNFMGEEFQLGKPGYEEIVYTVQPIEQARKFLDLMLISENHNTYNEFTSALMHSEDNEWLAPIFDDRYGLGDRNTSLLHATQMEKICKTFQTWQRKEEILFDVSIVYQNSDVVTGVEREHLEAQKTQKGNCYTICLLLIMMIRKGPGSLKKLCTTLKRFNIEFADTLAPFVEELESESLEFGGDKSKSLKEEKMEVDEHSEDATSSKQLFSENTTIPEIPQAKDCTKAFLDKQDEDSNLTDTVNDNPNIDSNNVSSTMESSIDSNSAQEELNQANDNAKEEEEVEEGELVEMQGVEENKPKLEFRDYQLELAEQANNGDNSLVVAPTGTGKTFVALCVCRDHLEKKGKDAKIIFMVPKVPLVKQQHEVLAEQCSDFEVRMISGGDPEIPVRDSILDSQITVMTPQILVDHLVSYENKKKPQNDLLRIQELTLLIFDECHHVSKGDPFNKIMNCYFDEKIEKQSLSMPQILGLTASPGIGPAKTHKKAEDSIKTLLGNLDVTTPPRRVVRCIKSLKEKEVKENTETVPVRRRKADEFEIGIRTVMDKIEARIKQELSSNKGKCKLSFNAKIPGSQVYEATVVKFHNDSKTLEGELSEKFMKYSNNLREYNNSLYLYDHVRGENAKKYIETTLFSRVNKDNVVDVELKKLYDEKIKPINPKTPNPLLTNLKKILIKEFEENSNSRCMIFVKTRAIADGLVTFVKGCINLKYELNPSCLTGANAKDDDFGKTKADQDQTIKAFREGRCKLIVATSVGEEGLDIPACNMMITYNYSTNEIGQVQRKGRARAMNSKTIMLAYDDSDIIKREKVNKLRVKLTDTTMDELDKQYGDNPSKLKKEIKKIQKSKFEERDLERFAATRNSHSKPSSSEEVWNFECVGCKKFVTKSDKFRHINQQHHFVVDPAFNKKAHFEVNEEKAVILSKDEILVGKTYCGNEKCGYEWGVRMKYMSCYISVLKIKSFVLVRGEHRVTLKKWKSAPFVVTKQVTTEELKDMMPPAQSIENTQDDSESEDEDFGDMLQSV